MTLPINDKKPYQKDRLDLAIDQFASLENPTISDLNSVAVIAQVQAGLNAYRALGTLIPHGEYVCAVRPS